jgi:phosphoglycolate phosphatase
MKKLLVFDFDGTLVDTIDDITHSLNKALLELGGKELKRQDIVDYIGSSLSELIEVALEGTSIKLDSTRERFIEIYKDHLLVKSRPYDGIENMLEELNEYNVKKVLLTNKMLVSTNRMFNHFGWNKYFDMIVCPETYNIRKPNPGSLIKILEHFNLDFKDALMVGDTEIDIGVAKAINIESIAVLYGYRSKEALQICKPEYFASSVEELKEILFRNI